MNHSIKEWSRYDRSFKAHRTTNSVENFWKIFKASIRSTRIHVSPKYMDRYLNEFTFRSNRREMQNAMFDILIWP